MAMKRVHHVIVRVTFDRPCTQSEAVAAVKDEFHGEFYPDLPRFNSPQSFIVRGVSRPQSKRGLR